MKEIEGVFNQEKALVGAFSATPMDRLQLYTCVVSYVELHQGDILSPRSRDNTGIGILSGPHSHPPVRIVAGVIQKSSLTLRTPSEADPASTCIEVVNEILWLFCKCSKKAPTSNLS